jgi:SAM-dependent methyltransferase
MRGDPRTAPSAELPFPPPEMRALVGPTELEAFDNPSGSLVYPYLRPEHYQRVFDFGCGCGRVARQLILQSPRPERYVGVDLHRGMIEWAQANLSPAADGFQFLHHNVYNRSFNPGEGLPDVAPLPVEDSSFTLVNALSVFTHLPQPQIPYYMQEVARVLAPGGVAHASFFLIDKKQFPMMMDDSNTLYVSYEEPSAAVLCDRQWICRTAAAAGLTVVGIVPPQIRNYQWVLIMATSRPGLEAVPFPPDEAPVAEVTIPPMPADAHLIGRSEMSAN